MGKSHSVILKVTLLYRFDETSVRRKRWRWVLEEEDSRMLYRGKELDRLLARLTPKIDEENRRIVAKGRDLSIRIDRYIDAQAPAAVREALRRLVSGRKWRFVRFTEFVDALARLVKRLSAAVAVEEGGDVCFAVDSLRKSSFWVVAMALSMLKSSGGSARLSVAVEDDERGGGGGGGLFRAFAKLPDAARIVLMDDATYSGDQLSYFFDVVKDSWSHGHPDSPRPLAYVAVPYMSTSSVALFVGPDDKKSRRLVRSRLLYEDTFDTMFYRRSLARVLSSDIVFDDGTTLGYRSMIFDVLGVRPTNSLFVFEHKVADSLSIPNLWLKVGPCIASDGSTRAYRCRADRISTLAKELRAHVGGTLRWGGDGPGTAAQRLLHGATVRLIGLMNSAKFRAEFMERVSLAPDAGRPPTPRRMPLLPVEFCDPAYREYLRRRGLRELRARSFSSDSGGDGDMPPCRRPPYQRRSYAALASGA